MSADTDIRQQMASAALNALLDVCRGPDGIASIDPVAARHALMVCMAMILEADPALRTPKDMREASETVARELRQQLRFMRQEFERTGERMWDGVAVPVQ